MSYTECTRDHFDRINLLPIDYLFEFFISVYEFRTINEPHFDFALHNKLISLEYHRDYQNNKLISLEYHHDYLCTSK